MSVTPTRRDHDRYWAWIELVNLLSLYREQGEDGFKGLVLLEDFRKAEAKYPEDSRIRDARMDLEMELEKRGVVELATQGS